MGLGEMEEGEMSEMIRELEGFVQDRDEEIETLQAELSLWKLNFETAQAELAACRKALDFIAFKASSYSEAHDVAFAALEKPRPPLRGKNCQRRILSGLYCRLCQPKEQNDAD